MGIRCRVNGDLKYCIFQVNRLMRRQKVRKQMNLTIMF